MINKVILAILLGEIQDYDPKKPLLANIFTSLILYMFLFSNSLFDAHC